jgi:hypothetical protein
MNCEYVEQHDILGSYMAGTLADEERDGFEEHFFGCEQCLQEVEAARVAREVLLKRGAGLQNRRRNWWVAGIPAAAAIFFGLWIWKGPIPPSERLPERLPVPQKQSYDLLGRFDPPAYRPATLRGANKLARSFPVAMKFYSSGNFEKAAASLKSIPGVEAQYYLGISEVLSGDRRNGITDLKKVVAAGDNPYRSEARFYLGKALVGSGDFPAAKLEFETLITEKSEWSPQAADVLVQLPKDIKPAQ